MDVFHSFVLGVPSNGPSDFTTRLLSGETLPSLRFLQLLYCISLPEDAPRDTIIGKVEVVHEKGLSSNIRFAITEGNEDKIFSINKRTGELRLTGLLDYEKETQYNLLVAAESDDDVAVTSLRIVVKDVNDNLPKFVDFIDSVSVIEENDRDLPKLLTKVTVKDEDRSEDNGFLFTLEGDGVNEKNPIQGTFVIHPFTGELLQIRPLDRDGPSGKPVWKLKIKVIDGQTSPEAYPADLLNLEKILKDFEGDSPFTRKNLYKVPAEDDKEVDRHRREIHLLTKKLKTTSNARKSLNNVLWEEPYVGKTREVVTAYKRPKNLIRISQKKTAIHSVEKIEKNVYVKRKRRANIRQETKTLLRNRFQRTFKRVFKATVPNRLPIWIRAPSAVRIGGEAKRHIEIDNENYDYNVIENGVGNDLNTMKFSLSVPNGYRRNNNIKKFTITRSFGDFKDAKNISNANKSAKRKQNHKRLRGYLPKGKENVDFCNGSLGFRGFKGCRRIYSRNVARKQKVNQEKNQTAKKEQTLKFERRFFQSFPRHMKKSLSSFRYRLIKKLPPVKESEQVLNFKIASYSNNSSKIANSEGKDEYACSEPLSNTTDYFQLNDNIHIIKKAIFSNFFDGKISKRSLLSPQDVACPSITFPINPQNRSKFYILEREFTLFVKDINDNIPKFSQEIFEMSVRENGKADEMVGVVKAYDADDVTFGTNALLAYSLEKNVVEEHTGERLFKINATTGEIRTALCCLDREVTSSYRLQVVATDGGGLQGTATVLVHLEDQNDNPPKFVKKEWVATVDEHFGHVTPPQSTILEASVSDPDIANDFAYRIIQSSGSGWQLFGIEAKKNFCRIYATSSLDYENERHKKGFRFKIQVSDQGHRTWSDPRHTDTAWVRISLLDINDHAPSFNVTNTRISLREDIEIGSHVLTLSAYDLDSGANGNISYSIDDPFSSFRIDKAGRIWVASDLDREGPLGPEAEVRVTAMDNGTPPLTETVSVFVTLLDVNDCAPFLISPRIYHIQENSPPSKIGVLLATDNDEDALNHGPPFVFTLDSTIPKESSRNVTIKFFPNLDHGRGGGEIWTTTSLDRERQPQILIDIRISDVSGLSTNHRIKLIIDDVNDSQMIPGSKTVYILKPKGVVTNYRLGRVYVNDPDDWDVDDKTFKWSQKPHQQFLLNEKSGMLHASDDLPDGRYELSFKVSDHLWQQYDVEANVSVKIRNIDPETFLHAIPISISSVSPNEAVKGWTPAGGGGILGTFIDAVQHALRNFVRNIEVVSVEENPSTVFNSGGSSAQSSCLSLGKRKLKKNIEELFKESSKVWIAAPVQGNYLDPVKLKGLLELKMEKIIERSNLVFSLEERLETASRKPCFSSFSQFSILSVSPFYESSFSSNNFQMQVVDMNTTSIVTALLSTPSFPCPLDNSFNNSFSNLSLASFSSQPHIMSSLLIPSSNQKPTFCTKHYCLNGGRCVPTETASRCICPGGTIGPQCKVISRTFYQDGWLWLPRLPSSLPLQISFHFMSLHDHGLIMYQGPFSMNFAIHKSLPRPVLALYLIKGKPVLSLEYSGIGMELKVDTNGSLTDGKWHSLHIRITEERLYLMVDFCTREKERKNNSHTWDSRTCFSSFTFPSQWMKQKINKIPWGSQAPLQLGGLAQPSPFLSSVGDKKRPKMVDKSFQGCISQLRIGRKLIDLGQPAYSSNSEKDCHLNKNRLCDKILPLFRDSTSSEDCDFSTYCQVDEEENTEQNDFTYCSCNKAQSSSSRFCEIYKRPVTLGVRSYCSIALSFVPDPQRVSIELKFKTKSENGLLLKLKSRKATFSLSLHISKGYLCLTFSTSSASLLIQQEVKDITPANLEAANSSQSLLNMDHRSPLQLGYTSEDMAKNSVSLCLTKKPVIDGAWHRVYAARLGHNFVLQIDGGDNWQYNETLILFESPKVSNRPFDFWVDVREGVSVGGVPEHIRRNVSLVYQDLTSTCLDDLRISGQQLPLPPFVNNTDYGQVTTMQGMGRGCHFNPSIHCNNTKCPPPFECRDVQGQPVCGCQVGQVFTPSGCRKINLCLFSPCLNAGTCHRTEKSFTCVCPTGFTGRYCEWNPRLPQNQELSTILALAITLSVVVFLITVIICFICFKRRVKLSRKENNIRRSSSSMGSSKEAKDVTNSSGSSILHIKVTNDIGVLYPKDDLRNYAYEGEGSSSESLGSVFTSIQNDIGDPFETARIDPHFCEVMDLVKGLPDAVSSPCVRGGKEKSLKEETPLALYKTSPLVSLSRRSTHHSPEGSIKIISSSTVIPGESIALQSRVSHISSLENVASV